MKNIVKTLLALMLILCLLSMFVACGDKEETPDNNEPDTEQNETPNETPDDKPDDQPTSTPLTDAGANTEEGWSDIK